MLHNHIFIWYLLENVILKCWTSQDTAYFISFQIHDPNTVYTAVISYHWTPDNESTAHCVPTEFSKQEKNSLLLVVNMNIVLFKKHKVITTTPMDKNQKNKNKNLD